MFFFFLSLIEKNINYRYFFQYKRIETQINL